jgi:hypothetical protein
MAQNFNPEAGLIVAQDGGAENLDGGQRPGELKNG